MGALAAPLQRTAALRALGGAAAGALLAAAWAALGWPSHMPAADLSVLPRMVRVSVAPLPVTALGEADPEAAPIAPRALWVQTHEVTVAEWNACHAAGGCAFALPARAGDPAALPATGLSQPDAQAFAAWVSARTGHPFRLPALSEWRALAAPVLPEAPDPIFDDPNLRWAAGYLLEASRTRALRPSGSFSATPDGILDLDGSVWEWTADCYAGSAGPVDPEHCPAFFVAGEHVAAVSYLERDPARGGCAVGAPPAHLGMRLVSDSASPTRF